MNGMIARLGAITLAATLSVAASAQDNLIENGDFEGGVTDPWGVYGDATLTLDASEVFEGSASGKVEVGAAGANFWDSGLQYNVDVTFTGGQLYTWAAFVKSEGAKNINWKPELAADPWTAYGEQMLAMGPEWTEYHIEFTPDSDVDPGSLTMHIAESGEDFWIDNARWYEGAYVAPTTTAVDAQGKVATAWGSLKSR